MDIKVNGHSGCAIEVVNRGDRLCLVKSTCDQKYLDRLIEQARKQHKYSGCKYEAIKVPRILNIVRKETCCSVEMEYIYSKNFVDFLETGDVSQIETFISSICHFIDAMIADSTIQSVPAAAFVRKFEDVCDKIAGNSYCCHDKEVQDILEQSGTIIYSQSDFLIPVGCCHGDLTLSNVLFNGYIYYLIDFLDSFIESPLIDIVKLRQDTAFHWSLLMYNGDYAKARMNLILDRMDERIRNHYAQYIWYNEFYRIFQLMNFLRILQYTREDKIMTYLKNTLNYMLHHEF